jgi:hypothetical protein
MARITHAAQIDLRLGDPAREFLELSVGVWPGNFAREGSTSSDKAGSEQTGLATFHGMVEGIAVGNIDEGSAAAELW